jgi:hypothetical protein
MNIINEKSSREIFINFLNEKIDYNNDKYLEIGALHNPWLKSYVNPNNVKYIDFTNTEQLKINYKDDKSVNINNIVNVDYILDSSKKYSEYINEKFNLVFSSHNIEHQPNFILHLNDVESVLVDGGYYLILCPDFRYIFDMYRNPTTLADILNAYLRKDSIPQFTTYIEHLLISNKTSNQHEINYDIYHSISNQDRLSFQNKLVNKDFNLTLDQIITDFNSTNYRDCHVWKFYYENFFDIMNYLYKIGLTKFKVELIHRTEDKKSLYEFGIILKKY